MEIFRITRTKYAQDTSGEGARIYGGRWNRPGVAALYTSQARSLALLELIVHFNSSSALKMKYSFITYEIEEKWVEEIPTRKLPASFGNLNNEKLWQLMDEMFFVKNIFVVKVPSVLVPQEYNFVLNPVHSLISKVKIHNVQDAILDQRFVL